MNNKIYEFFGDFWHGNPKVFDKKRLNPKNGKRYGDLYSKTLEKIEKLQNNGFLVEYN